MSAAKTALIVRGGWPGHQPVETTNAFVPFLEANGFAIQISETAAVFADAELMHTVDLVLLCVSMGTIERDEITGLRSAVANGTGLAGWHGGIVDAYRGSADYLQLVGGQFAHHPSPAPSQRTGSPTENDVAHAITMTPVGETHPITAGFGDIELNTEKYWVLTDDYNEVLATTTFHPTAESPWLRPVVCPAIWTRSWGHGKVFVATPGHILEVFDNRDLRTIIERGLLWASR
jgi:type 1 glutamine amidotransferase